MLSKGVGVYHMPNQNTRIGVTIRKMCVLPQRRTADFGGSSWRFFLTKFPFIEYHPHQLFRRIFKKMQPGELALKDYCVAHSRCVIETGFDCFTACRHVGRLLSNYSLVLYKSCLDIALRPFKDLGWHKEKKHRHHHRLSLLLKGLLATKPVVIFSKVR